MLGVVKDLDIVIVYDRAILLSEDFHPIILPVNSLVQMLDKIILLLYLSLKIFDLLLQVVDLRQHHGSRCINARVNLFILLLNIIGCFKDILNIWWWELVEVLSHTEQTLSPVSLIQSLLEVFEFLGEFNK